MHFTLCSITVLFMLSTFVQSAPTSLDAATLLMNAQQAQNLNAQFQSANGTASGACNNGDTTCVKGAIATCVNGQFDTSNGRCATTQHCFALPSVASNGTIIACTSEKSAQSLINASGATGGVTGSGGSGASTPSNSTSASSTSNAAIASPTAESMDPDCTTPTPTTANTAISAPVVTVTVTVTPSNIATLPSVTQTLSPDQASSALASLLASGGPAATATPDCSDESPTSAVISASVTDIQVPPETVVQSTATPSATSPSAATPAATVNNTGNSTTSGSSSGAGGYGGY